MAYHKQIFPDKRTGRRGGLAKYNADLDAYVSDRIQSSQTEFYEQEAFEVNEISKDVYGGVLGTFINDKTQEIKGNIVLPLKPNVTQIPLIGEHISVIEFNGQHYYTDIINKLNSPNENALAGTSDYDELKKYGETFTRNNNVKHIDISEGDIVFNGRFNNSITLGSNGANKPITKIVVGHRVVEDNLFKQTIDRDAASIYLISDEASTTLDGQRISGKKVLIKSDGIFISGRQEIRLNSSNVKLGGNDNLEPVVKGDQLVKLLDGIVKALSDGANAFTTEKVAGTTIQTLLALLPDTKSILSEKVKTS